MNFLQLWYKTFTPKQIILIFTIILIAISLPITLFFLKTQQEIRSRAEGEPVSFTITPETVTKPVGETFDAQLFLNAAGNQVSATDFTLQFGNDSLEMVSFTPTDAFNTQLKNIPNNNNGTLIYTAGDTAGKPAVGNVQLGTIRFKTKSAGVNTLSIQKAKVTPSGKAGLVPVTSTVIASYTIQNADASPTNTQTPTATPTTIVPLPTENLPTPTLIITPTPIPGGARISLSVALAGLGEGIGSNPDPKIKQKRVTVCLYPINTDTSKDTSCSRATKKVEGLFTFNSATKKFEADTFDLGIIQEGDYEILIKSDKYLRKRVPETKHIKPDTTTPLQLIQLKSGDITGDNIIDIQDYNAYVSCFGEKFNTESCLNKETVDLNDDSQHDTTTDFSDYKILLQNISTQEGD